MPLRSSHLREVNNPGPPSNTLEGALRDAVRDGLTLTKDASTLQAPKVCTLGVHDDAFSKLDVLINGAIFPSKNFLPGTKLRIVAHDSDSTRNTFKRRASEHGPSHHHHHHHRSQSRHHEVKAGEMSYVFVAQELPTELLARHPHLEISLTQRIANTLGFKNHSQVTVSLADDLVYSASHVEIAFRDAYLTRADMWRLVSSELAGKSMYKGQRVTFMNTIKAQIKNIYHRGVKRQSAFFDPDTKPVFRSESARYVLFIQMSREMWGFDTDGTGEIMFHKVVNGFLPELFGRWDEIGAHHLVSIILFTRMEYDQPLVASLEPSVDENSPLHVGYDTDQLHHKDFYRVLVSDVASGQWSSILEQLKRDFKTFLRDVSITSANPTPSIVLGRETLAESLAHQRDVISGKPTAASKGNILEAINVASSQFSGDYIDRDLVRTGLSVIVVSPGTGVFEVDHNLLSITTDVLIENGVSIDLVCLSRMPLHSVPLFKYKKPTAAHPAKYDELQNDSVVGPSIAASIGSTRSFLSDASSPGAKSVILGQDGAMFGKDADIWRYAIPSWLDVSFWIPSNASTTNGRSPHNPPNCSGKKEFIPRVKMYEVQMMGIMENEMSNIAIPYLKQIKPDSQGLNIKMPDLQSRSSTTSLGIAGKTNKSMHSAASMSNSAVQSHSSSPIQQNLKAFGSLFDFMDQYDEAVFRDPRLKVKNARHVSSHVHERLLKTQRSRGADMRKYSHHQEYTTVGEGALENRTTTTEQRKTKTLKPTPGISQLQKAAQARAKLPRQISLGFRGFGGFAPKATPVAAISSTTALYDAKLGRPGSSHAPSLNGDTLIQRESEKDDSETDSVRTSAEITQPITIKQQTKEAKDLSDGMAMAQLEDHERISMLQDRLPLSKDQQLSSSAQLALSPRKAMAPWLTVLNPCNPSANRIDPQRRLGRWHHVFPRPIHASHVKWKSLCSPASVPLTTEDFPTPEQLSTEYDEKEYTVEFAKDGNVWEYSTAGKTLPREMLSARFSHGFQVVLSDVATQYFQIPRVDDFSIFDDGRIGTIGSHIVLTRGFSIHKLTTINDGLVEVKILTRRPAADPTRAGHNSLPYRPVVRTTLSDVYEPRELTISPSKETYDWQRLDKFIGGHEAQRNDAYPDLLNFWRARFVLIPVERPSNQKRRVQPMNEDNDEEIRLEGIKKLTQLWQKHRYIPPEERRLGASQRKVEQNPLDIIYRTMKPSSIVAAEMNVLDTEEDAPKAELSDSDLYERANLKIEALAQTIQGDRGIRITNRRWHWRLHYNCFIGLELTTWLVNNVRDIETREDAVNFGNELMKQGVFVHVERRHNFRDGNFFYQITNEHLVRKEPRSSWFGRSVPSTPLTENMRGTTAGKSRSGPLSDEEVQSESIAPRKQKLGAELSQSLVYDVDHRHRSYRSELINLHYDRISSADDCYHLRIDWMNVTPKLIEDSIANWSSLAERNGLRLVELPIAEASKINEYHPFRGPYYIKLAKAPPETQPQTYFDATSLIPKQSPKHLYQEAILRKFNFVLDLEAATDFPASMDVSYSWGKPNYKYPQYISRTGVILAQITHEGNFLLLANRLYNNRTAGIAESQRNQRTTQNEVEHHHSPARQPVVKHLKSPGGSPYPSPMVHAVPDVVSNTPKPDNLTPEKIKDELEAFCLDAAGLEQFYEDLLKQATPVPMTPMMESIVTTLAPPPALSLRDEPPHGPSAEAGSS